MLLFITLKHVQAGALSMKHGSYLQTDHSNSFVSPSEFSAIIGPQKLVSKHATVHSWLTEPDKTIGITCCNKRNRDFTCPMARSTCILTRRIYCVLFTFAFSRLFREPLKGGMFSMRLGFTKRSCTSKPQSAMRLFPQGTSSKLRIPRSSNSCQSLMRPLYSWLMKIKQVF